MTDLKPCPFCGGDAALDRVNNLLFVPYCKRCGAACDNRQSEDEAIEAWNTREEKTCQVIGYSVTSDERVLMCQLSCGHRAPSFDLGPFNPSFSHCPRCNAKVMNNDN